jgi:PAS domain S-box-containing protein
MNDLQMKYHSGEIEPEEYIQALERRLAEAELNIQVLAGAQFDAILESGQTTPLLLRQAQLALQRSNELLEQRVAERTAALAESEMKYRALFENSLDMVFLTRTDGTIVDANPAACQALGMTREEIRARGRAGIVQPDTNLEKALKRRAATSRVQDELTFIRKDGSTFLAEIDSVIVNPEWKDWTTFVTARDITERRQMEAALQESESRFRTMADGTPVMIWVHDQDGKMEFVNQAYTDYFGVTLEQVKTEGWQPLVHPEDTTRYVDVFIECLQQHRTFQAQCRVRRPNGQWYWLDSYGQPRFSAAGEFIGMAGSSFDITQRKQAEEAIKRYAGQLEQLNRDLAFANRELKDFTYVASHDLQEPLRKVSQFGRLLQMNAGETLTEDNHVYLDRMVDAAKRMQEMIGGLLDYSRITTQGNPFKLVDLSHIAHEVLSDLEIRIEKTEGSVAIDSLPVIEADPLLMRQLFQNLIGNALKFHQPDHPPIVKVWAEDNDMEGNHGEFICLYFQDNGIGFDEQHLEKLFLPFVRLHGRSNYEGSGMGLSICRKIVERHQGKITAKSIPDEGATFTVTLPKRQNNESEQSSELKGITK